MDLSKYVFAWDWDDLGAADWCFRTARAYLDSSISLFERMLTDATKRTFHHARPAAFLFHHALELFLKGAVVQAGGPIQRHHNLKQLYSQVRNLHPAKRFEFQASIADVIEESPATSPASEFMRYPLDESGRVRHGNVHFKLDLWLAELRKFADDFERLEREYKAAGPPRS